MDAKYLAEIKVREQAATPGPWESGQYGAVCTTNGFKLCNVEGHNNAAFIAHARQDISALVAEVERLQAAQLKAFNAGYDVQQKHLDETVRQYGAEIDRLKIERDTAIALHKDCANELSNAHHNHTDDFMRLNAEISTLKRALELACQDLEKQMYVNFPPESYIKQAQEEKS